MVIDNHQHRVRSPEATPCLPELEERKDAKLHNTKHTQNSEATGAAGRAEQGFESKTFSSAL